MVYQVGSRTSLSRSAVRSSLTSQERVASWQGNEHTECDQSGEQIYLTHDTLHNRLNGVSSINADVEIVFCEADKRVSYVCVYNLTSHLESQYIF